MRDKPLVKMSLTMDQAESFSNALSDLLCWHAGFKAGREGADLDGDVLGVERARDLNIKLKRAMDDAEDPDFQDVDAPEAPDAS